MTTETITRESIVTTLMDQVRVIKHQYDGHATDIICDLVLNDWNLTGPGPVLAADLCGVGRRVEDALDAVPDALWDLKGVYSKVLHLVRIAEDAMEKLEAHEQEEELNRAVPESTSEPTPHLVSYADTRLASILYGLMNDLARAVEANGLMQRPSKCKHLVEGINLVAEELLTRQPPEQQEPCDCALCVVERKYHTEK